MHLLLWHSSTHLFYNVVVILINIFIQLISVHVHMGKMCIYFNIGQANRSNKSCCDHTVFDCIFSSVIQVMSKRLPQQQLTTLVFMLFEGLVDSQVNCCRASSVILNTLLKNRGGGLQDLVAHTLTHPFAWAAEVQTLSSVSSCVVGVVIGPRDA